MDKNMSRKTVLAIQLRDLKREVHALQQDYKKQMEEKVQPTQVPKTDIPVEEDETAKRERLKFEKAEKNLQKKVRTILSRVSWSLCLHASDCLAQRRFEGCQPYIEIESDRPGQNVRQLLDVPTK